MYLLLLVGFAISAATTLLLVFPLRALALRFGWVDHPDSDRKKHGKATPYLGGLAIAAGFAAGIGYIIAFGGDFGVTLASKSSIFWGGAVVMLLTGLYDDIRGLGFKRKFAVQIVVAYALLHAGYRIDLSGLPFMSPDVFDQALYTIPLTVLWIVGVMNAVNLIDGMDGLAGGVMAIAFGTLAFIYGMQGDLVLVAVAIPICGALLGFLRHNFNPASIFMGDAGSLFLGYLVATYALEGRAHSDPWLALVIPVFALALPLVDTAFSIVRRLAMRRAIFAPDHDHIHHRLRQRLPIPLAVLTLYGASFIFGLGAVAMSMADFGLSLFLAFVLVGCVPLCLMLLGYDLRWSRPEAEVTEQVSEVTEAVLAAEPASYKRSKAPDAVDPVLVKEMDSARSVAQSYVQASVN